MAVYTGTDGNDLFLGTGDDDAVTGGGGNDMLRGAGGSDVIEGGRDDDWLEGQDGDDLLFGQDGDDLLRGGNGIDRFDGGEGDDRVRFGERELTQGVVADLRTQIIANDGVGNTESMRSIEGLGGGSVFADRFYGDGGGNVLFADSGDVVRGFAGDDDIYVGAAAGMRVDGGDGVDRIASYAQTTRSTSHGALETVTATLGVIIDLAQQRIVEDGFGTAARISGFEDAAGHILNDTLTGSALANRLEGWEGADRLSGGDGADVLVGGVGRDRLTGGEGADTFVFSGFDPIQVFDENFDLVEVPGPADSGAAPGTADRITDFARGDRVDLSGVDADTRLSGNQTLTWRGGDAFTGAAGEVRVEMIRGNTFLQIEVNGQEGVDMLVRLDGLVTLTQADIVL